MTLSSTKKDSIPAESRLPLANKASGRSRNLRTVTSGRDSNSPLASTRSTGDGGAANDHVPAAWFTFEPECIDDRAQLRAGLLMTLESPAARAAQIARQMLLFGRIIPIEELVATIDAISVGAVRDLAGAIMTGSAPTIATVGPAKGLVRSEVLADRLGAPTPVPV